MTTEVDKILNLANAFLLASERNEEQRQIANNKLEMLLIPAVTNRAFSIELYLKAILIKENTPSKGHKLFDLFNKLKPEIQTQIVNLCNITRPVFNLKLHEVTDVFVEWRYIYEADSASLNWEYLRDLSTAVKEVAIN